MAASALLTARENPGLYPGSLGRDLLYEISLKTRSAGPWLSNLPQACRLIQALTQGQLLEQFEIMDFLIWSEGFFLRVKLKSMPALSDFLSFLKQKTAPPDASREGEVFAWEDELQWIRLITPENLAESTRDFLANAEKLRSQLKDRPAGSSSLFFFYRNRAAAR
ncbi:MAG TPA: hypothetical protein VMU88_06810 [bacterium]|nr:hypothetical protein [bacterium]